MTENGSIIETGRLILQPFAGSCKEIRDMLKNWISDPAVQNEYGEPVYTTAEDVEKLLTRYRADPYRWAICEKESGECIGQVAFCKVWEDVHTAEIEYCIGSAFQGNGYAGEALSALIDYGFTHTDFRCLEAYHRAANPRSEKVLLKSAMHPTDTVERFRREGITPENEICYCIQYDEWLSGR